MIPESGELCYFSPQQSPAFFLHECDRDELIGGCTDVVHRPGGVAGREHFADTFGAVALRIATIVPVKQLYPVVQLMLLPVDGDLNFDLLLTGKGRDGNGYVARDFWGLVKRGFLGRKGGKDKRKLARDTFLLFIRS